MATPQIVHTTAFGVASWVGGICWDENKSGMYITTKTESECKLLKVTRAGVLLSSVTISLSSDGGIDQPGGLDIVENQYLYVTNSATYRSSFTKMTLAGVKITTYAAPYDSGHWDIAYDGSQLITAQSGADVVIKMTTECVVTSTFSAVDVLGVAVDPTQNLIFAGIYNGYVKAYATNGGYIGYFDPPLGSGALIFCWWDASFLWLPDGNGEFILYAEPPPTPTVTAPNGGESIDTTANITWTRGSLQFLKGQPYYGEVQLSTDNGVTWNTIIAQSAKNALTANHDFSNIAYTAQALIRVREFNDPTYRLNSSYDQSNAVFTIGVAPLAPTNLSPSGTVLDVAEDNNFSWISHDNDNITAFRLIIYESGTNNIVHDTGEVAGDGLYTLASSTIAGGDYQFVVRSKDTHGLWGPYSQRAAFTGSTKPVVSNVSPANAGIYDKGILTVTADYTDAESDPLWKYQAILKDNLGNTIEDSGEVIASSISHVFDTILENNTAYSVDVAAWDDTGLKSDVVSTSFTTDFIAPEKPVISAVAGSGKITVNISNPVSVPAPDRNYIYKKINGSWVRIAKDYPINTAYDDYAVVSGEVTEYQVVNVSETETTATSDPDSASTTLTGVWLHDVTDPAGTVHQFQYDGQGRDAEWQVEAVLMQFAGRTNPVAEFGEGENERVTATLQLFDSADYAAIQSIIKNKSTLCYRDGMGKKVFGVVTVLPITDEKPSWHVTTITVSKTDYTEAV